MVDFESRLTGLTWGARFVLFTIWRSKCKQLRCIRSSMKGIRSKWLIIHTQCPVDNLKIRVFWSLCNSPYSAVVPTLVLHNYHAFLLPPIVWRVLLLTKFPCRSGEDSLSMSVYSLPLLSNWKWFLVFEVEATKVSYQPIYEKGYHSTSCNARVWIRKLERGRTIYDFCT